MEVKFNDIAKANESIKTMAITRWDKKKNAEVSKDYAEVNQRIKAFRMVYPTGTIITDIISHQDGIVLMKSTVMDETGKTLATGFAQENMKSSQINSTSYIENCETSAIGRALGMCGFGIDTSVASYEEVKNAQAQQSEIEDGTEREKLLAMFRARYTEQSIAKMEESKGFVEDWSLKDLRKAINFADMKNKKNVSINSQEETF